LKALFWIFGGVGGVFFSGNDLEKGILDVGNWKHEKSTILLWSSNNSILFIKFSMVQKVFCWVLKSFVKNLTEIQSAGEMSAFWNFTQEILKIYNNLNTI